MVNYVDCGNCPRTSTGCVEGECLKSKVLMLPKPAEFNLSLRSPYRPYHTGKVEAVFWVYFVLVSYYPEIPKEMLLKEGIADPILKSLSLPESIQTVGDFINYVDELSAKDIGEKT